MVKYADEVNVTCNPEILEVIADKIDVTYTLTFPQGYFHPKAILEVTPVLVYEGGEVAAQPLKLQGEKVLDNYNVIGVDGESVQHKIRFDYVEGMAKSHLELRTAVIHKDNVWPFPAAYKIADGANITYKWVELKGETAIIADNYQKIIHETEETNIMYAKNSAQVRPRELTKAEIKEFQNFLKNLPKDERRVMKGTDIIAYASPEGPVDFNEELSEKRMRSAEKAFQSITRKINPEGDVNLQTIGEDWEGFQELVAKTDLGDKDLILRVLTMYSDPVVREREIRNMSAVYKILEDKVLPKLRRARLIANVEFTNYSDEELIEMTANNMDAMGNEALLYAATLTRDNDTKIALYKKAAEKYNCKRGYNNLAAAYLNAGKVNEAATALAKCDASNPVVANNLGVIEMRKGNYAKAAEYFAKSGCQTAKYNQGALDILNGKYAEALDKLYDKTHMNGALAHLLNGNLDQAEAAMESCKCSGGNYIKAVIAARKGQDARVQELMEEINKVPALAEKASKDIEFAKYR
jgi:tetratricopeptide (TPR) repeat protein